MSFDACNGILLSQAFGPLSSTPIRVSLHCLVLPRLRGGASFQRALLVHAAVAKPWSLMASLLFAAVAMARWMGRKDVVG